MPDKFDFKHTTLVTRSMKVGSYILYMKFAITKCFFFYKIIKNGDDTVPHNERAGTVNVRQKTTTTQHWFSYF